LAVNAHADQPADSAELAARFSQSIGSITRNGDELQKEKDAVKPTESKKKLHKVYETIMPDFKPQAVRFEKGADLHSYASSTDLLSSFPFPPAVIVSLSSFSVGY